MTSSPVDFPRRLLTLGRVDRVRVQVGFRASPDDPPYQYFLLDVSVTGADSARENDAFDERQALAVLEPVLQAGAEAPQHYSLHLHRWHTSWGVSPNALEIGLLVTVGTRSMAAVAEASKVSVTRAFHDLMDLVGQPQPTPTSREHAILRARRGAATAYGVDPDTMSLSAEEHHPADNAWTIRLRTTAGDAYDVVVGVADGYAGSVRVRREQRVEVFDSIGSE